MADKIFTLTDGNNNNTLIQFISSYFPFIDEPLKLIYRGRTYNIISTSTRKFGFEDFFISHNCLKCKKNCCSGMYVPIGFEQYWPKEKLKGIEKFNPRRYTVYLNDQKMIYYIGLTGRPCHYQNRKACTLWDSDLEIQKRCMGCHFYPMTFWWEENTIIFTKHCAPYLCKGESLRYTEWDFNRDLNTFVKMCKEIETVGLAVNYAPVDALKEQCYFSV